MYHLREALRGGSGPEKSADQNRLNYHSCGSGISLRKKNQRGKTKREREEKVRGNESCRKKRERGKGSGGDLEATLVA